MEQKTLRKAMYAKYSGGGGGGGMYTHEAHTTAHLLPIFIILSSTKNLPTHQVFHIL